MTEVVENRRAKEYWEWRVKTHDDEERMIWYGNKWKWDALELVARRVLNMFKDCSVLEVACGYGRHSDVFNKDKYFGFDFSDEMIRLAREKHPGYEFQIQNATVFKPDKRYDVVFGVMAMDLVGRFAEYADVAVVEIGPNEVNIKFKDLS